MPSVNNLLSKVMNRKNDMSNLFESNYVDKSFVRGKIKKSQIVCLRFFCVDYLNRLMSPESLYLVCCPALRWVSGNLSVP